MLSKWSRSLLASSLLLLIILLNSPTIAFQNKRYTQQRKITLSSSPRNMSAFIHHVDEDATANDIKQQLSNSPLSLVVAVASFAPKESKALVKEIASLEKDYEGGTSCCGPSPIKPSVLVIKTDASDELEEIAIELGLSDVPSYQIYKYSTIVGSSSSENKSPITLDKIRDELKSASAPATSNTSTSCCPPPPSSNGNAAAVCCPDGSNSANAPSDPAEVLRLVQQSYANTVNQSKGNGGDGGGCCVSVNPETLGYTQEQIIKAGKDSNLGLGW